MAQALADQLVPKHSLGACGDAGFKTGSMQQVQTESSSLSDMQERMGLMHSWKWSVAQAMVDQLAPDNGLGLAGKATMKGLSKQLFRKCPAMERGCCM